MIVLVAFARVTVCQYRCWPQLDRIPLMVPSPRMGSVAPCFLPWSPDAPSLNTQLRAKTTQQRYSKGLTSTISSCRLPGLSIAGRCANPEPAAPSGNPSLPSLDTLQVALEGGCDRRGRCGCDRAGALDRTGSSPRWAGGNPDCRDRASDGARRGRREADGIARRAPGCAPRARLDALHRQRAPAHDEHRRACALACFGDASGDDRLGQQRRTRATDAGAARGDPCLRCAGIRDPATAPVNISRRGSRPMRRRALSRALIALGLLSTVTAAAGVAGSSALAGAPAATRGLTVGFAADNSLLDGTAATRSVWLDRAVAEGARIVRVPVVWSEVAPLRRSAGFRPQDPGSPGYNWSSTDETVRELSQHGLTPLLMILSAPAWAEGAHRPALAPPGTWEPNAGQFASFARAAAQRYSGAYPDPLYGGESLPRVRYWQAWNEPNLPYYLSPQWTRVGNRYAPASPNLYRRLLNGFYAAVKGVARSNYVLMGGTAPYGDPPGGARMQPLAFYRSLFCLSRTRAPLRCPAPVHLDGVDHHPYGASPEQSAFFSDDVAVPNVWKIGRVLNAAVRDGHVLPRAHKDMWVTELGWNSAIHPKFRSRPRRGTSSWPNFYSGSRASVRSCGSTFATRRRRSSSAGVECTITAGRQSRLLRRFCSRLSRSDGRLAASSCGAERRTQACCGSRVSFRPGTGSAWRGFRWERDRSS